MRGLPRGGGNRIIVFVGGIAPTVALKICAWGNRPTPKLSPVEATFGKLKRLFPNHLSHDCEDFWNSLFVILRISEATSDNACVGGH
jgi:hypothetical protein